MTDVASMKGLLELIRLKKVGVRWCTGGKSELERTKQTGHWIRLEWAEDEGDRRGKCVRHEVGKGWGGKRRMVKSRWVGWRGQSNLISSALSQSIDMPGQLSHVSQRTYAVGRLKDTAEMSLPCVSVKENKQYKGTQWNAHAQTHTSMCTCAGAINTTCMLVSS